MSDRHPIDLRTDTCTHPTPEMYAAMAAAPLGDDGWRDDPTVLELESFAARLLGKEAALFLPSGTMSNLVALMVHATRGGELVAEATAWAIGGAGNSSYAAIAGLAARPIRGHRGAMDLDLLDAAIYRVGDHRSPQTALVTIENTHTAESGAVLPLSHMAAVHRLASRYEIPVFLDGARLVHAAVALDVPMSRLAAFGDCVSLSLCKALGAPVGSIITGTEEFIRRALFFRKILGGAMRQSGLLAACGLVALQTPLQRIRDYHQRASDLASGLNALDGMLIDPGAVETNLLTVDVAHTNRSAADWAAELRARRVLVAPMRPALLRLVTHSEISAADVQETLEAFRAVRETCPDKPSASLSKAPAAARA